MAQGRSRWTTVGRTFVRPGALQVRAADADVITMRAALAGLLAAGAARLAVAPAASADAVAPEERRRLPRLGRRGHARRLLRHRLRGTGRGASRGSTSSACGICATASTATRPRSGATGTSATTGRSTWPPLTASASPSSWAAPAAETGTLDQLLERASRGRLRHATEALEAPNEFDKYVGGRGWADAADRLRPRALPQGPRQRRRCAALPVLGPVVRQRRRSERRLGDQRAWLRRRQHPPLHGRPLARPAARCAPSSPRRASCPAASRSGRPRPASTTRCGLATAGSRRCRSAPPPCTCCAPSSSTSGAASDRTYAYELIDEKPDPRRPRPRAALRPAAQRLQPQARLHRAAQPASTSSGEASGGRDCARCACGVASRVATCAGSSSRRPTAPTSSRCGARRASGTRPPAPAGGAGPRGAGWSCRAAPGSKLADPLGSGVPRSLTMRRGAVRLPLGGDPVVLTVARRG